MAITGSELVYYASSEVNYTATNGGRISMNEVVAGGSNTWWPTITEAELGTGATHWRKGFLRINNPDNEICSLLRIGLFRPTPGSDALYLAEGTQTNVQSDFGTPTLYGCGKLDAPALAGDATIDVLVEDGTVILFRNGDKIRISDETAVGGAGNFEVHVINGVPTVLGDVVTITLTGTLANGYNSTNTYVSSLLEKTNVQGVVSDKVVTSTAGTLNEAAIIVSSLGSLRHTVTLTFTTATNFTATSDYPGVTLTGGAVGSEYAPINNTLAAVYFTIPSAAWGGTYVGGDTVVFVTTPPCVPILEKRVVPASAAAIASQTRTLMFFAES